MNSNEIKSAVDNVLKAFDSENEINIAVSPETKAMHEGELLKMLRMALEVQQGELAKRIEVSQSAISQNEKRENVNSAFVDKYLNAIGLDYLIFNFLKYVLPVLGEDVTEFVSDPEAIEKLKKAEKEKQSKGRTLQLKEVQNSMNELTSENIGKVQEYIDLLKLAQKTKV